MKARGFILGKFMPPHRGHLFLCETALRMVRELTVLVCSTPAEPIAGALRAEWMREALPGARVLHLQRDMPQTPDDHPDFWRIWREAICDLHREPIDRVFAGEDYGFRLAAELGAEPVIVDPDREAFDICATQIRNNPAAHWADIAAPARSHFQKRITIAGPESTGKTTLARRLGAHFETRVMPEYGRAYDVHYKQSRNAKGEGWREDDFAAIARTHASMRAALAPLAGPLFIEDTGAVTTAVWAEHLLGARSEKLEAMAEAGLSDHYLLLSPETPWTDDGVRYAGARDVREWFFTATKARLDHFGAPYDIIDGADWAGREAQAVAIAERVLNAV